MAPQDPRLHRPLRQAWRCLQGVEALYSRAQLLAEFPQLGHRYRTQSGRETRVLLWGHYGIVYLLPNEDEVHILGVFHGAMQLENYLK